MRNKIMIILPIVLCTFGKANAQDPNKAASSPTEVIVNGKPYSQHKAEQDAIQQQKAAAAATAVVQPAATVSAIDIPTPAQQQKMQVQPVMTTTKVQPAAAVLNYGNGNANPNPASVKIVPEKTVAPAAQRTTAENGGAIIPVAENKIVGVPEIRKPASKTEAAVTLPAIQVSSDSVLPESKQTESKPQPVTPNNPNAPKTKTD